MPVPRQRLSSRRGRTRASHHALKPTTTSVCAQCKKPVVPHKVCPACGYYNGRNMNERPTAVTTKKPKPTVPAKSEATAMETPTDSKTK